MLENNIEKLRAERQLERDRYNSMSNKIEIMLTKFASNDKDAMIDWEALSNSVVGQIYHVNKEVCFICVSISATELVFVTVVQNNGKFGLQEHDIDEYCKVLMGQLIEPLQDFKVFNTGEINKYPALTKHMPKGGDMLNIFWVTFKKNQNGK